MLATKEKCITIIEEKLITGQLKLFQSLEKV